MEKITAMGNRIRLKNLEGLQKFISGSFRNYVDFDDIVYDVFPGLRAHVTLAQLENEELVKEYVGVSENMNVSDNLDL